MSAATLLCSAAMVVAAPGGLRVEEPLRPLPLVLDLDQAKVDLGSRIYSDSRLSSDNSISCASCHDLSTNGSNNRPLSQRDGLITSNVKTPTVYNSKYNFVQFWDGRATSQVEQIGQCIKNPRVMKSDWEQIVVKLRRDSELTMQFNQTYEEGLTSANVVDALTTFLSSLVTSGSAFDQWLLGDDSAINNEELNGYMLFKSYGCVSCHHGINVGGNMFSKFGVVTDYFQYRHGGLTSVDIGRQNVTDKYEDRFLFKVPSLRLASKNSHFFHDASTDNLNDAIRVMAHYQLGRDIPDAEVSKLAAFIKTLSGTHPRMQQ